MTRPPILLSHGLSRTPEYRAWQTARHRCTQPTSPAWDDYGGRGITMCAEWLNDPAAFIAHVGQRPTPRHELDRIDNDRGYEPGNVRWTTRSTNDRNRRTSRLVTHATETLSLAEWSERTGVSADLIGERLDAGWSPERAITTPAREKRPNGAGIKTGVCTECRQSCTFGKARCRRCENRARPHGPDGRFAAQLAEPARRRRVA